MALLMCSYIYFVWQNEPQSYIPLRRTHNYNTIVHIPLAVSYIPYYSACDYWSSQQTTKETAKDHHNQSFNTHFDDILLHKNGPHPFV